MQKYAPPPDDQRYLRNTELARYLGVSRPTLHRWKRDPALKTPQPLVIRGIERNDRTLWDTWLRKRAVSRIEEPAA